MSGGRTLRERGLNPRALLTNPRIGAQLSDRVLVQIRTGGKPGHRGEFCAGLIVSPYPRVVLEAAPILAWTIGKPWSVVRAWATRKRMHIVGMVDPVPPA